MKKMRVCFCAYYPDGMFKKIYFEEDTSLNADEFQAAKFREIEMYLIGCLLITRMVKTWNGLRWEDCSFHYPPLLSLQSGDQIYCTESIL